MKKYSNRKLPSVMSMFKNMSDYAKILYRLYNKLSNLQEETKEYNECLENIKLTLVYEKKFYDKQSNEDKEMLLELLFMKDTAFQQDSFYLMHEFNHHNFEYYSFRRIFNHLKVDYLNRKQNSDNSIEELGMSSLEEEGISFNEKNYIVLNRKNEYEKLIIMGDYIKVLNYYQSLALAKQKDHSFSIYQNLLLFINPYLERKVLFGEEITVTSLPNSNLLNHFIIKKLNSDILTISFDNLSEYNDKVVENKNELMMMKLLIILIDSIADSFNKEFLSEYIRMLASDNFSDLITGKPSKTKLKKQMEKYLNFQDKKK